MSRLLKLLDVQRGAMTTPGSDRPAGRKASARSAASSSRRAWPRRAGPSNRTGCRPTCICSSCAAGEAGDPVEYTVTPVFDGRTAAARRVDSRQGGRLLTTSSVSFAVDLPGPEHGHWERLPGDPDTLPQTGPAGPAPSMPLEELDIRIADGITSGEFVRRFWWRATVPIPDEPLIHTLVAAYVTDVYMIDPRSAGARVFDEGPHPSQWHDRFVDLVPPAGPRERMEPAWKRGHPPPRADAAS